MGNQEKLTAAVRYGGRIDGSILWREVERLISLLQELVMLWLSFMVSGQAELITNIIRRPENLLTEKSYYSSHWRQVNFQEV